MRSNQFKEKAYMSEELAVVLKGISDPEARRGVEALAGTSPIREALEYLGDFIRGRRAQSQAKVLEKTFSAISEAGLEARGVVPAKTLVPLLEYASLEEPDDDKMVERWSHLLARALAETGEDVIPPSFPHVLRQLEPVEALFLESLVEARSFRGKTVSILDIPFDEVAHHDQVGWRQLENLERLGLLEFASDGPVNVPPPAKPNSMVRLSETTFGWEFVKACQPFSRQQVGREIQAKRGGA
jgi:hypothetical protein